MAAERVERKLAAILAADVAGYSRLMGQDEEGTLERLKSHRRELIDPKITEYRGRIVKTTGDGILIEFPSVVDAVRCAVEVQKGMVIQNASVPEDKRIEFRVGINLGDIIIDGDDIHGDGVNIAARLEALAQPGSICISQKVREEVQDKLGLAYEDIGDQQLKNIARPVRVCRVRITGVTETVRPVLVLPDKPSIAVLPFQNMSGDPEQEFFADGMSEDITTALSKLMWFFVIARNSTFAYKAKSPDVRQVARELGVRYVLEGSVRKSGNRLRITAQLIDATTGSHIWAGRYDREVADIFALQDEITQSVVAAIEPQLYAAENIRIQSKPPESLDAWGCIIRALWHIGRMTGDDSERAKALLKQAIELSPRYAKAHSLLAVAEVHAAIYGGHNMDMALSSARQNAQTALALDDNDPWGCFASGFVAMCASRYDDAIAGLRRAIEMNPNFALAHGFLAGSLAWSGQPDTALAAVDRAIRMSPRDPFNARFLHFAAVAHFVAEHYAEGVACEEQGLRERRNPFALRYLAACYVGLGQLDKAKSAISDVLRLQPNSSIKRDAYGYSALARVSDHERYAAALRRAGLPEE